MVHPLSWLRNRKTQFGEVFGQKTIHLGPQDHTGQLVGGARGLEEMRRI